MQGLEKILDELTPDLILVYGDTNSTLAGALVAAKASIPLAHVEAGLRSFRRGMPEEVNRVVTDRLADFLFCPTTLAVDNLSSEGRTDGVHLVGDVMFDAFLHAQAHVDVGVIETHGLEQGGYVFATVHRAENTDDPSRLKNLFGAFGAVAADFPVVLPLHPRTKQRLEATGIDIPEGIVTTQPLSYGETLALLSKAAVAATDSGGLQKEAYFASVPCVTLRDETEWVETVASGWNRLASPLGPAGLENVAAAIVGAVRQKPDGKPPNHYGDGDAASKILSLLAKAL